MMCLNMLYITSINKLIYIYLYVYTHIKIINNVTLPFKMLHLLSVLHIILSEKRVFFYCILITLGLYQGLDNTKPVIF